MLKLNYKRNKTCMLDKTSSRSVSEQFIAHHVAKDFYFLMFYCSFIPFTAKVVCKRGNRQ